MERYGRWLVLGKDPGRRGRRLCRCDCGTERSVAASNLSSGASKSCGCAPKGPLKHGLAGTSTYSTWKAMRARCNNSRHKNYADYGGRGISVCERWNDFALFLADMGEKPAGMSIDRIDPSRGYAPDNCRWATQAQQMSNMRRNKIVSLGSESLTVSEWARRLKISASVIYHRLAAGWSDADALSIPVKGSRKLLEM